MAEAFGRALGRPVAYVEVPWEEFREAAGEEATSMYRFFEERGYAAHIPRLREIHPGLVDLETFLRTVEPDGA